jgi:hypothetical protein
MIKDVNVSQGSTKMDMMVRRRELPWVRRKRWTVDKYQFKKSAIPV